MEIEYKNILVGGVHYYGKHMMITAERCNTAILEKGIMSNFLIQLADDIDMIRFGEPLVERFGDGIHVGLSAVQLITTSALMTHTNDEARDLYLDVFSCKWFDEQAVIERVEEVYDPENINFQVVLRK